MEQQVLFFVDVGKFMDIFPTRQAQRSGVPVSENTLGKVGKNGGKGGEPTARQVPPKPDQIEAIIPDYPRSEVAAPQVGCPQKLRQTTTGNSPVPP